MNAKIVIGFASAILSRAIALGYAPHSFATTANGNGRTTDVGAWYARPSSINEHDSSNAYVLTQDMANFAVASG
jgi:hypothetical protein